MSVGESVEPEGMAEREVEPPARSMICRIGGGLGVLVAMPAGGVVGCVALVGTATVAANRFLAGLVGVTAMVAVTLAVASRGACRVTMLTWGRRTLAGAAVGLSIVLVGGAVWVLVYAPAPIEPRPYCGWGVLNRPGGFRARGTQVRELRTVMARPVRSRAAGGRRWCRRAPQRFSPAMECSTRMRAWARAWL